MTIAAATVLLVLFSLVAAVDGVLVHLVWLRLHARPGSWVEHVLHTASAVLFPPILVTVFLAPTAGVTLWVGVALLVLLVAVEVLDVGSERASRSDLGGVGRGELALHVVSVVTRTAATALALASRPAEAWRLDAPPVLGSHPAWVATVVGALVPGAIAIAVVHLALAWRHRPAPAASVVTA